MNKFINRKKKKMNRKTVILLTFFCMIFAVGIVIATVRVSDITVTGNAWYTDEQIIDYLFENRVDYNSAYCYYESNFAKHKTIPFVQDYKIVFSSPGSIEIIVYEKSVVGYVSYMSSYMYFDKDGIVVESTSEKLPGIPWIAGLKFGQIVLYQPLPVENQKIFDEILNLTQILSVYGMDVDEIMYNSHGEATLMIDAIEVVLGSNESMNGKIGELNDMLPQLAGQSGILYLDTYDETGASPMYTFKKK